MQWLTDKLDTTWKRVAAAAVLSAAIVFAVSTFASSSYIETQKVQIESAQGQHCKKWKYDRTENGTRVSCQQWENR